MALTASKLYCLSAVQISSNLEKVSLSWVRKVVTAEMVLADCFSWARPWGLRKSWGE